MNQILKQFFLLFLLTATLVGCGSDSKDKLAYANVSGTVTFNGMPLEKGQITFSSEGRPPTVMDVVAGKYSGHAVVGSNKIQISAKKKSTTKPKLNETAKAQIEVYKEKMKGSSGGESSEFDLSEVESLPKEWNTQTKQTRVVEAGAPNEFTFEMVAK